MVKIAPFSGLNLYSAKPTPSVVNKNQPPIIAGQKEFEAAQELVRKSAETYTMAKANYAMAGAASLFNPQEEKYAMQNILQAQFLPVKESDDLAKFASPSDQSKLSMYQNMGQGKSISASILDLLKV